MNLKLYKQVTTRIPNQAMQRLFSDVVRHEASPRWQAQVNLVFTTDRRIQELNLQYRGKNMSTDVLSFNLDGPERPDAVFGEIYISVPTAARQAKTLRHSLAREYLRLACHGLMHLFGYDHQEDREAERMEARERQYLAKRVGK